MIKLNSIAIVGLTAVLLAGCGSAAVTPAAGTGGTVKASLDEMMIHVDKTSVAAGQVTFVVKNTGAVAHELVILRTDVAQDKIPAGTETVGKMDETGNLGETGDIEAGASNTFTVSLAAGHYVLICNEVGHYTSGMHMTFTVN
ncbi:MAG: sulfocyanin-like copper-binding protein [Chloroflexota bacterium]